METVLDEDSATTVTTRTSRSSRTRSKGPSKSTILRNKQKEKEELNNRLLLQEVKDRYETLASEDSTYEIIRKISEEMKSRDLTKLSFNNPLLSFILDLDRIDPIINDLLPKSLLEEASQYENV